MAVIILLGVLVTGGWQGWKFFKQNLSGSTPALLPAQGDIAAAIDRREMPLVLPKGFSLGVFAKDLGNPRVMVFDPNGTLIVSQPDKGLVTALPDIDKDGKADQIIQIVQGSNRPHGLAFKCQDNHCKFFLADAGSVWVFDYSTSTYQVSSSQKLIDLPSGTGHFTRSLLLLPPPNDNQLLVSVGSSCNVCNEDDWRRAKVLSYDLNTRELKEFASGLRNTVFQTIRPNTNEIWATEMGRDLLGDDTPPDEINILKENLNYGWPYCYGKNTRDSKFDPGNPIKCGEPEYAPSLIDLQAHSAPLGLVFVQNQSWPEEYQGDLLVAYHGSWNRSVPTGYKLVRIKLDGSTYQGVEDFISGWLMADNSSLGRPAGLLFDPAGKLYISDDKAGLIYLVNPSK